MGYWDVGDGRPRWPMLLAGAVAGALLVGLIWGVQAWTTKGDRDEPVIESSDVGGSSEAEPESPSRLARCREVLVAQNAPLRTAEASLTQWEVHVGAMNQLVTGAITLAQARAFWDETRIAASGLVAEYNSAVGRYAHRTARCPLTRPGTMTAAEARCAESAAARGRELYEASVAHATWQRHVHHMEMLRTGEMSPEEATRLWLRDWQIGVEELRAYRAAAKAADGQNC